MNWQEMSEEQYTWDQVPEGWPKCDLCDNPAMEMVQDTVERLCSETCVRDMRPLDHVHRLCSKHARPSQNFMTYM